MLMSLRRLKGDNRKKNTKKGKCCRKMNGGHVYVQPTQYLVAINDKEVKKRKKVNLGDLKKL